MLNYKLKIDAIEKVIQPVNHVFTVDVSGSMYNVLPKIKQHIKNKLSLIVKENDTVSIIYFSARNECGVIFEGEKINNIKDLNNLHNAIDKYLSTLSLTGFVEPIQEAIKVVKRLNNGNINNFIFMTDGYDNQWQKNEILNNCKELPKYFDSISFIEYGWYCNRALLSSMAECTDGLHVFSEEYENYEKVFENLIKNDVVKKKKVFIETNSAYYVENNEVFIMDKKDGFVLVPENINLVYLFEENESLLEDMTNYEKFVYLFVCISKMKTEMVWKALKSLGDVNIIKKFSNCFTKQEYTNIKDLVKSCIFEESLRFQEGIDYNLVPKDNAYTILDLLNDLMIEKNYLQTNDSNFSYNKIGASIVQKNVYEEQIKELKEKLAKENDIEEIKKIAAEIQSLDNWNPKFVETVSENGEEISNLVFNESRPNISLQVNKKGTIELPDDKVNQYNLPKHFNTNIVRNYTIIKDGILNIKVLPVKLEKSTFEKLKNENLVTEEYDSNKVYLLDLSKLPLINRSMIKNVSAVQYFTDNIKLSELKAKQKLFKYYLDIISPKKQVNLLTNYSVEAVEWLESIGIKDYGFSPKVSIKKSGDFYYSKELNIKVKGLSSIPSVNTLLEKIKNNSKLNAADKMLKLALDNYNNFVNSEAIMNSKVKDELIKIWLEAETKSTIKEVRELQKELNRILYSIIIGQIWFDEFSSIDENELIIKYNDEEYKVQAILEEKEIPI